jgi:hypothetical protein
MATTLIDWRPSALPAARPSVLPAAQLPTVQAHVLGCAAVTQTGIGGSYVPGSVPQVSSKVAASDTQVNNSIGISGAAMGAEGASELMGLGAGILQRRAVDEFKQFSVKGIDARGIPPRGRRKV